MTLTATNASGRLAASILIVALLLPACADVWGFGDLQRADLDAAGPGSDANASDVPVTNDGDAVTSAEGGQDGAPVADAADDAQPDAALDDGALTDADDAADSSCTVAHSNGTGQTFDTCEPLDSYDQASALAACGAYVQTNSLAGPCTSYGPPNTCQGIAEVTTLASNNMSYSWVYSAPQSSGVRAGYVLALPVGTFTCPNWPSPSGSWN